MHEVETGFYKEQRIRVPPSMLRKLKELVTGFNDTSINMA